MRLMDAMEFLGGRRKDVSSFMWNWSRISGADVPERLWICPMEMEAVRTYEGVLLRRKDQKKTSVIKDEEWRLPCPGKLDCPLGNI